MFTFNFFLFNFLYVYIFKWKSAGAAPKSAERKNVARVSCLYANNILLYDRHCPFVVYYLFVHFDIRTSEQDRIWVHNMIHTRQKYGGYYHLGQEKEKKASVTSPGPF